jgi:hypothetical protein
MVPQKPAWNHAVRPSMRVRYIGGGEVGLSEVLVLANARDRPAVLEPRLAQPGAIEAQEPRQRVAERTPRRALDDRAEQDVAGVRVGEDLAGRTVRAAVGERPTHLRHARPAARGVREHRRLVARVAREVVEPAGVVHQHRDGDRAGTRDDRRELGRQPPRDRIVEREPMLLNQPHDRRRDVGLGVRRVAEDGRRGQWRPARERVRAAGQRERARRRLDVGEHPRGGRLRGDRGVHEPLPVLREVGARGGGRREQERQHDRGRADHRRICAATPPSAPRMAPTAGASHSWLTAAAIVSPTA